MQLRLFRSMLVLLMLVLLVWTPPIQTRAPGFKACITQGGIDYVVTVALPIIVGAVGRIQLPVISGSIGTPIGSIDYSLTNLIVDNLNIPSAKISISSSGLIGTVGGGSVHVRLDWHYRESAWPHISDSGNADVDGRDISIQLAASVYAQNEEPQISVQSLNIHIGKLDINLHGGASWLYQIFVDIFSNSIRNELENALKNSLKSVIENAANNALKTLPIKQNINKFLMIDYGLFDTPIFVPNTHLTTKHVGEFYYIQNPIEAPFTPSNVPDSITNQMLQIILSDFFPNSVGSVFFQAGILKADVYPKDVPEWVPIHLNTSDFCSFLPGMCQTFPNQGLVLHIEATESPFATFNKDSPMVTAKGLIAFSAIEESGALSPAFAVNFVALGSGVALIDSNNNLTAHIQYLSSNFSLVSSHIGDIPVEFLQFLIDTLLEQAIVPAVNSIIERGIILPTVAGVSLINPSLIYGDGYIAVSTDIKYTPTNLLESMTEENHF